MAVGMGHLQSAVKNQWNLKLLQELIILLEIYSIIIFNARNAGKLYHTERLKE